METRLDLTALALDDIAVALEDQGGYEHRWLIDPATGAIHFWTEDCGIDGQTPVDLDELNMLWIEPLPSYVWYADMADFANGISDEQAGSRLARALKGKGAFRRFKDRLHTGAPHLPSAWHAFHDARATRRAVEWLIDNELVDEGQAASFIASHPDPDLP